MDAYVGQSSSNCVRICCTSLNVNFTERGRKKEKKNGREGEKERKGGREGKEGEKETEKDLIGSTEPSGSIGRLWSSGPIWQGCLPGEYAGSEDWIFPPESSGALPCSLTSCLLGWGPVASFPAALGKNRVRGLNTHHAPCLHMAPHSQMFQETPLQRPRSTHAVV